MQIKVLIFTILTLFIISNSYAEESYTCAYSWKIEECVNNQNNHRSIEDFVCIQWSKEKIVYQIVLDEKFKEFDKEIESFLENLYNSKDYYFWQNKKEDYIKWVDLIEEKLGDYWEYAARYKALCSTWEDWIISEVLECLWWKSSNYNAKDFLEWSNCVSLYKTKLVIFREVAYNILKENKYNILKDNHKVFTQSQRKSYDALFELIRINIGYIERLWKKWPSKTNSVH